MKGYAFLSFYLPMKSPKLKEMVSVPAVCNQGTNSSIRGYTLSGKCVILELELLCGLLCYIMGHTEECTNVSMFFLLLFTYIHVNIPVKMGFGIFSSALKVIDSSATVTPPYFS